MQSRAGSVRLEIKFRAADILCPSHRLLVQPRQATLYSAAFPGQPSGCAGNLWSWTLPVCIAAANAGPLDHCHLPLQLARHRRGGAGHPGIYRRTCLD